ncbi:uncharacterized protein LOC126839001 [Adelges cooleyi]|uniref:uncharacterized protein LOC126839001 n=1 Tax=Adelges cooleyi TaxID=133065 RepID=UPI00217FEC58|nr:uncharacterized protein LOC126839001 [Adelges cooleyi]
MSNTIWLGALLLFGACSAYPQNPNVPTLSPPPSPSNIVSVNVNTKRYAHAVNDHFLSITLDPSTIFSALQDNLGSAAINMAKALSPAYLRISGPECNSFIFQGAQDTSQSSPAIPVKRGKNITITGWHWSQMNDFIAQTDLDLVVALNVMNRQHGSWNLSNTLDLISFSDKHGYDMAFQLGHDMQAGNSRVDGASLGKDATRLRKVLEAFPRYISTPIVGPDAKSCDSQDDARYLKSFIAEAGPSLTALTYQVPFASERSVENPTEMLNYIENQMETKVWQRDLMNKYLGKLTSRKPIWIVESGNKDRKGDFSDGLIWAQRLVAGARIGINVMMRKPSMTSLKEPTPDYWVSILHKALIGSEVFDVKIQSVNKTRIESVAHCTRETSFNPNEGILAPEFRYNRGAITVFGVNMESESVKISLKTGSRQSVPLHQYFLTANNRKNKDKRAVKSLTTLLNGQKLSLSVDGELPVLSPKIRESNRIITIPSQSVFFFVLPDSKSKACMAVQIEERDMSKNGPKNSLSDLEDFDNVDYDALLMDQDDESISGEKNNYVSFRTKYTRSSGNYHTRKSDNQEESKTYSNEMKEKLNEDENNGERFSEPVVKYVTFSNNNWLSKFPKSLKNPEYSMEPPTTAAPEITTMTMPIDHSSVSPTHSRREKYHILAQAVVGKRHPERKVRFDPHANLDTPTEPLRSTQKLKIVKRSISDDSSSTEVDELIKAITTIKPDETLKELSKSDDLPVIDMTIAPTSDQDVDNNTDRPKREEIKNHPAIPESQSPAKASEMTQQTATSPTPATTPASVTEAKPVPKRESYIQKIKSRKEQALAKANERVSSHRLLRRKQQYKSKEELVSSTTTEKVIPKENSETIVANSAKTLIPVVDINDTSLQMKNEEANLEYNKRSIESSTIANTEKEIENVKNTENEKIEIVSASKNVENVKNSESEKTNTDQLTYTSTDTPKDIKSKLSKSLPSIPKPLRLPKPKTLRNTHDLEEIDSGNSKVRESRETTERHMQKLKTKPAQVLSKVRTPKNVDQIQTETNEKVAEVILDNLKDVKSKLQSEHIVSPIGKKEERVAKQEKKFDLKEGSTAAKLKALEEKHKMFRVELENKLRSAKPKVHKRSLENDIVEDDMMDMNDILVSERDGFGSNDIDIDVASVLKREAVRYPRSLADLTLKLNEVNTYVDKNKQEVDPKTNEIIEDDMYLGNWKMSNNIRPVDDEDNLAKEDLNALLEKKSVLDNIEDDENINANSSKRAKTNVKKRKSLLEDIDFDEDTPKKMTNSVVQTFLNHMQNFWKYIKRTFHF